MAVTNGIGSSSGGFDVKSTVQGLVQLKRAPEQQRISDRRIEITSEISAFGRVRTAVEDLRDSAKKLGKLDNYSQHTVSNTDKELFTADASSKAAPGDFNIEVVQLATSHKLILGAVTDRKDIGFGALTLMLGEDEETSFSVELMENPRGNSLDDLAQMINSHKDNKGIIASIIQDKDGAHLLLSSDIKGEDSHISIQSDQTDSELNKFDTDSLFMKSLSSGQDAVINVDGLTAVSSSNTFSNTIKGLDITVLKASEKNTDGSIVAPARLKIENDRSNIKELVQSFVDSFNKATSTIDSESRHDDASDSDGSLRGNSVINSASRQIRNALNETGAEPVEYGEIESLSELGVTTMRDGSLSLDTIKLDAQIENNFESVKSFFVGKDGFAKRFAHRVETFSQTGGAIDTASNSLVEEQRELDTRQLDLDRKMQAYEERLSKQYTSLDSTVTELNSQLGYIQGIVG